MFSMRIAIAAEPLALLKHLIRSDGDSCISLLSCSFNKSGTGDPGPALFLSSVYLLLLFSHHLTLYPMASPMLSAFKGSSTLKLHMTIIVHLWLWPVALFALDLLYIVAASDKIEGLAERTYFYIGGR